MTATATTTCTNRAAGTHPAAPAAQQAAGLPRTIPERLSALREYAEFLVSIRAADNDAQHIASLERATTQKIRTLESIQYKAVELACDIAAALDGTPAKLIRVLPAEKVANIITVGLRAPREQGVA